MKRGWIKLWRKAFDSGLHRDHKLWVLWTWILVHVTRKKMPYVIGSQKIELLPGQTVTSIRVLAKATGMSVRQARTRLSRLERFGNVTHKPTNKYSLLTVVNWELYQGDNRKTTHKTTRTRHTPDTHPTQKQESENLRKRERNELHPLPPDFCLTEKHKAWAVKNHFDRIDLETELEKFCEYYTGNGGLRANWDSVFYGWLRKCKKFDGELKQSCTLDEEYPLVERSKFDA